ncbi:hypothetical protein [Myxococcus sp. RHSTA-1-4]|uniref:hypothetical protein n=1 Tax=Myxococcus sp. RHSTA-1-4 TaxID=2874601 RepID=UPI001CBEAA1B|nr:hypothetical protein [Myxococcus sp. RHSTA-1-4]MBZ4421753.1 hypothetical protein [Myxococcus sp. RHSTA-1-4]
MMAETSLDRGMQQVFLDALHATDRQSLNRYVSQRGRATDAAQKEALKRDFMCLPLLDREDLRELALDLLRSAVGAPVTDTVWMQWRSIEHTWDGIPWKGAWADYGRRHMEWAQLVVAKGQGPAYSPTENTTGYRNNASTQALYALHLDADGVGDWWELIRVLGELRLAFLIHRSGGHTPALPKWRVILPLAQPFVVGGTEPGVLAWRNGYAAARVVFGALARLTGPGFDPATDGPHHPWFPAARRRVEDPVREVYQNHGATLDLHALLRALPSAHPTPPRTSPRPPASTGTPSLLQLAFEAAGMLGRPLGNGKYAVLCPWNELHTQPLGPNEAPTSASVIFGSAGEGNMGQFHCSHSCGTRKAREVLDALPAYAVEHAHARHQPRWLASPTAERGDFFSMRPPGLLDDFNDKLPR